MILSDDLTQNRIVPLRQKQWKERLGEHYSRLPGHFPVGRHSCFSSNAVLALIGARHFVRRWKDYGLTWTVLGWLPY